MRDSRWDDLLEQVKLFYNNDDIEILNMGDIYIPTERLRRKALSVPNLCHYKVDLFNSVVDMQLLEHNN